MIKAVFIVWILIFLILKMIFCKFKKERNLLMTKPDDLIKFITMLMMKQENEYKTKQYSESTQKIVFSKETRKDE